MSQQEANLALLRSAMGDCLDFARSMAEQLRDVPDGMVSLQLASLLLYSATQLDDIRSLVLRPRVFDPDTDISGG